MRNSIGYIALSLLAAAFAGCSSADTTSTTGSNGKDPLSGALAKYNAAIVPLANACTWTSVATTSPAAVAGTMTVTLAANDVAQISVRSVDKALLVNGQTCDDAATTANKGIATTTLVKKVVVGPLASALTSLDGGNETIIIDTRNGQFALAGTGTTATGTGIAIDLGTGGNDIVAIAGSTGADAFGCIQASSVDTLGIKSAISKDVTFVHHSATMQYIIDMSDGNDTFSQNNCTGIMAVYGGLGSDTINAGATTSTNDTFSGGSDPTGTDKDVLSYAARTSTAAADAMVINLTTIPLTTSLNAGSSTPASPFVMGALRAGVLNEADVLVDDFETVTGSTADDFILSGSNTSTYTLNGGPGNDSFASLKAHPAIMNGNAGTDSANYSGRSAAVSATMGAGADDGETGDVDNVAIDVENFVASNSGGTVTGSSANNVFFGGLGDDIFNGGTGDDTFMAAATSGTSTSDDGDDQFNGGTGNDTMDYSLRTPGSNYGVCIILDGTTHSGVCTYTAATGSTPASWDAASTLEADIIGADVENAYGSSGTYPAGSDHIIGNLNPNVLLGFGGADFLEGLAGNDQLDANTYSASVATVTQKCNPVTLACVGVAGCTCAGATITPATNNKAKLDCGGDPLDIGTDSAATFVTGSCKIQQ